MNKLLKVLGMLGVAWGVLSTAPAMAQQACSLEPTAGTVTRTIGSRSYTLNVPAGLVGGSVPLLIALHGGGSNPSFHENETGWTPYAASHNFIVAYPKALNAWWDLTDNSVDTPFLKQVAADISSQWCVDPKRIHVAGFSRGGMMSHRVACDDDGTFASVAPYAGYLPTAEFASCSPQRKVPVAIFHSTFDPIVPYFRATAARDFWKTNNGCTGSVTTTVNGSAFERYTGCAGGTEVWLRQYFQSHNWPFGSDADDIRNRMWAFFQAHPLP
ncbi:hypothetical protein D0B54_00085 [Solimonas sp. K1W22B-7]|uniref:alpha/beta hydrolase family esterase n=1 Tax=Solimonas sp. K1W22B-7 TaxID=2303331 RepID=UPI000E32D6F7|nr:PHB depolymerase family esterase [Solimonas sp. K1W22B-7]AXQ27184.1 hypothetical protein D0B54_00085 [Solimonas sp. K1W22B-7]